MVTCIGGKSVTEKHYKKIKSKSRKTKSVYDEKILTM